VTARRQLRPAGTPAQLSVRRRAGREVRG
jgi:hypothetical protein